MLTRPVRAILLAALVLVPGLALRQAAIVSAHASPAADPPNYVLRPQAIVDVCDAVFLHQNTVAPHLHTCPLT